MHEETNTTNMNTNSPTQEQEQEAIEWRSQIILLRSKGYKNQSEIARRLGWDRSTISRDISWINEQAQNNLKTHLETRLVIETENVIAGIEEIILGTWTDLDQNERTLSLRDKLSCRSLLKELYQTKLNILTSAPVIQRGLNYVQMYKDKLEQLKQDREQPQGGEGQDNNQEDNNIVLVTEDEEEEELTEDADTGSVVSIQEPKPKTLFEKRKPEPIYE